MVGFLAERGFQGRLREQAVGTGPWGGCARSPFWTEAALGLGSHVAEPRERPSSGVPSLLSLFPGSSSFVFLAAISWFSGSLGFHSIFLPRFLIYSQHWHVMRHHQLLF